MLKQRRAQISAEFLAGHGRIVLVFLMLAGMSVLAGCGETGPTDGPSTRWGAMPDSFIGGNEGLKVQFLAGAPPDEIYDRNFEFSVNVRLENVGEWTVPATNATVKISGINPVDINLSEEDAKQAVPVELFGAQRDPEGNDIAGAITNVDFPGLNYVKEIAGNVEFTLKADACYEYGTKTITQLCVLEDLLGITRKAGEEPFCDPTGELPVENSGGTVHIKDVKQGIAGTDAVSFTFTIEHVGDGFLFKKDVECNSSTISNKDRVWINISTQLDGLTCNGLQDEEGENDDSWEYGLVQLYGREAGGEEQAIFCTQQLPVTRSDYSSPVSITMEYEYKDSVSQPILVKHAPIGR